MLCMRLCVCVLREEATHPPFFSRSVSCVVVQFLKIIGVVDDELRKQQVLLA